MIRFFGNFPHTLGTLGCVENCQNFIKLHQVGCGNLQRNFFVKPFINRNKFYKWLFVILIVLQKNATRCPFVQNLWHWIIIKNLFCVFNFFVCVFVLVCLLWCVPIYCLQEGCGKSLLSWSVQRPPFCTCETRWRLGLQNVVGKKNQQEAHLRHQT